MARSHYSYEKRQIELKKKKKREEKLQKKQEKGGGEDDSAAEYLAMLRGEPFGEDAEDEDPDAVAEEEEAASE